MIGMISDQSNEREYCRTMSNLWNAGSRPCSGTIWRTICDLMLAGFAILICCNLASAQTFRITERQESFVITERPVESNYLVMFSADWCAPCQAWKHSHLETVERSVGRVRIVNVDEEKTWGIRTVPTFWIAERSTQTKIGPAFVGTTSPDTLIEAVKSRKKSTVRHTDDKTISRSVTRNIRTLHPE